MSFSRLILILSQDQFAFTWEACQWTFTVLHCPTVCHSLVAEDLAVWTVPSSVRLNHYIDDMLTSDSLNRVRVSCSSAVGSPPGLTMSSQFQKIQGPGLSFKILCAVWLSKTKVMPSAVIRFILSPTHKIQSNCKNF